jgi:membrane protease YdiL (CAAX protease family)
MSRLLTKEYWQSLFKLQKKEEIGTSFWMKPDLIDIISFFLIIIFFIAIFQNITYLSSGEAELQNFALRNMAVVALAATGVALKALFDKAAITKDGVEYAIFITKTQYEQVTWKSLLYTFLWFGVAFIGQFVASAIFRAISPLSIFEKELSFAIIGSVAEELFFSLAIQSALTSRIKFLSVPVVVFVFGWYHIVVYALTPLILYVILVRVVYSVVYLFSRRFSSVALAHLLNNILSAGALL